MLLVAFVGLWRPADNRTLEAFNRHDLEGLHLAGFWRPALSGEMVILAPSTTESWSVMSGGSGGVVVTSNEGIHGDARPASGQALPDRRTCTAATPQRNPAGLPGRPVMVPSAKAGAASKSKREIQQ